MVTTLENAHSLIGVSHGWGSGSDCAASNGNGYGSPGTGAVSGNGYGDGRDDAQDPCDVFECGDRYVDGCGYGW